MRAGDVGRLEGYDPEHLAVMGDFVVPFDRYLGVEWELLSPDRVVGFIDVQPHHLQPYGIVHGGVHTGLVEAVGSLAGAARAAVDGKQAVGVHNATSFLRPAREGRITATATPIHIGRTAHLWRVDVTRDDGEVAAHGELRMQVLAFSED